MDNSSDTPAPAKKPPRRTREQQARDTFQKRMARTSALVKNAAKIVDGERKCRAKRTNGEPCGNYAIKGGRVCVTHGGSAPQVRKNANKRLLAMVEPALVRLQDLVMQEEHLPTALGAIRTVLERAGDEAIGALKAKAAEQQTMRPIVIGIKVGGIAQPTVSVGVKQLPEAEPEAEEGELVDED